MKILFIGDLHLGKKPPHSTRESALRHRISVDLAITNLNDQADYDDVDFTIQLGDVFDSYHANSNEFMRARRILDDADFVLKGNHDHAHNTFNQSALQDLVDVCEADIIFSPQVRYLAVREEPTVALHLIPYMPTQKEFVEALSAMDYKKDMVNIVCLHTNMYPENFEGSEVENNLPESLVHELRGKGFDYFFSGHEHNYSTKAGVIMVGSIYPFSFGDLTSKGAIMLDTKLDQFTTYNTWGKGGGFRNVTATEFLTLDAKLDPLQFVEITGEVLPDQVLPVAKHMRHLFKESPVLSIKNSLKVRRSTSAAASDAEALTDWKAYVNDALDSESRKQLFQEIIK